MSVGRRLQHALASRLFADPALEKISAGRRGNPAAGTEGVFSYARRGWRTARTPGSDFGRSETRRHFWIEHGYATDHGATLTASGLLIRELSREWNPQPGGHGRLQKPAWSPRVHRVKEASSITLEHNANYCHFLFEGLPRLHILDVAASGRTFLFTPTRRRPSSANYCPCLACPRSVSLRRLTSAAAGGTALGADLSRLPREVHSGSNRVFTGDDSDQTRSTVPSPPDEPQNLYQPPRLDQPAHSQ